MKLQPWSLSLKIIAGSFHGTAITCTIFRLLYRWHRARFWWEDGSAAFALALDIVCMVCVWLEAPMTASGMPPIDRITNWIVIFTFPSVGWICRTSVLFSIVRVANPSQQPRRIAFAVGCSFVIMWAALMGQRVQICLDEKCEISWSAGLSQLITDVLSDSVLVAMPIRLLRHTKLTHRRRIMIYSVFSASLSITAVTILHSVILFTTMSDGIIIIGHVRAALSLIVCNLLVIVTFVYRIIGRDQTFDLDATEEIVEELTTVDLNTGTFESSVGADVKDTRTLLTPTVTTGTWSMAISTNQSLEVEGPTDLGRY